MLETTRLKTELGHIQQHLARVANGPRGREVIAPLREATALTVSPSKLLWQALHNDCLRVVYVALAADDQIVDDEIDATYDYLFSVARHYADVLPATYGTFAGLEFNDAREFLARYAADAAPFGCKFGPTKWAGLDVCRRAAMIGDGEPLEQYTRLIAWLCDESVRVAGVDIGDARLNARLDEITELRRSLIERVGLNDGVGTDLRVAAFLGGPRVFAAVTQADSVFEEDPFDVEEVHAEVRTVFERMVANAVSPTRVDRGRMLLVLGESGSGKTHLMRAFRSYVHKGGYGFAVYAQLQSRSHEYSRYLLHNVIESLERSHGGPGDEVSGLLKLARGLARTPELTASIGRLAEEDWPTAPERTRHVNEIVDELLRDQRLKSFDPDLLRALLFLQCSDARITPRAIKYLRCEAMTDHDRHWIGNLPPKLGDDEPIRMIQQLARLAQVTQDAAFVIMVDQAELAGFDDNSVGAFTRAIDALYAIVSATPSAIAVISCLGDMYVVSEPKLTKSMVDRLTADPPLARLAIGRTGVEIEAIIARRLEWLYADAGAVFRREDATYPFSAELLNSQLNRRTRSVLEVCHQYQEACSAAGAIIGDWKPEGPVVGNPPPPPIENTLDRLAAEWNEALHTAPGEIVEDASAIFDLLDSGARTCGVEMSVAVACRVTDSYLEVDFGKGPTATLLTLGIVDRKPGGRYGFTAQMETLLKYSRVRTPVAVRTVEFPRGEQSEKWVAELLKKGGRKVVCAQSDLGAIAAMRAFEKKWKGPDFDAWRKRDKPLLGRPSLAQMFGLASEAVAAPPTVPPPAAAQTIGHPVKKRQRAITQPLPLPPPAPVVGDLQVGTTVGLDQRAFDLPHELLVRHSGVLGSPGSGKTTLALNLVEQLLERDIPVVLVDRKGDLAGYARADWWKAAADKPRAQALAARLDVRLFTPGNPGGRALAFSVVPRLDGVPEHERSKLLMYAASSVAAMLRLGAGAKDQAKLAILAQAITVLAERTTGAGLEQLIGVIESRDDALIARANRFDDKLFGALVTELETLRLNEAELFHKQAEPLTAELLLARSTDKRTPLSIVSTRFLGDTERVQAWIAQLFVELQRWAARAPAPTLQALVMLDEADLYMPATSKPPSKEPLLDLLKRARSGGLGIMLATQTPGDLDYKSRDIITSWFIGKIAGNPSIEKVRPLLERKPAMTGKLGGLPAGHFVVASDAIVTEILRRPSLLRTDQLSEQEIVNLARSSRLQGK